MTDVQNAPQQEIAENETDYRQFVQYGVLKEHEVEVTSLQVSKDGNTLVSGSRDKSAVVWDIKADSSSWAEAKMKLCKHSHFVSGVCLSGDATHLLTCSWDKTAILWKLQDREVFKTFVGHKKDILDICFSPDNRRIFTASRDNEVIMWNVHAVLTKSIPGTSWATSIACVNHPEEQDAVLLAIGYWDGRVAVYTIDKEVKLLFDDTVAHKGGRVQSVCFNEEGTILMTGGSDRKINIFDIKTKKVVHTIIAPSAIHKLAPCPTKPWICAATYEGVAVYELNESGSSQVDLVIPDFKIESKHEKPRGKFPDCKAIAWSPDGATMYTGYTNGDIYVWRVRSTSE